MLLRTILLILAGAGVLTACGGDDSQSTSFEGWQQANIHYSYPYDGQEGVSPRTPLVLRFSQAVSVNADNFTLYQCEQGSQRCDGDSHKETVALQPPRAEDDGRSVVLETEAGQLKTDRVYSLVLNGIETEQGTPTLPEGSLAFRTRLAKEGALDDRMRASPLQVETITPDGDAYPFVDFSTIQVRFSQPVDRESLIYGALNEQGTVSLVGDGEVVPATLLSQDDVMVVDPESDLTPGTDYTLTVAESVHGMNGDALTETYQKQWTAKDTSPRSMMVQEAAGADDCMAPGVESLSPLTGQAVNCVPVIANLLGDTTVSRQSGNVFAELAYTPAFPDETPLRIPKGSLLKGEPLAVKIGGQVDAGFDSGEVTVTFISDATGYLLPNPYTDDEDAPRQLRLTLNVAFDTEDARANGAFNQNLLQVELVGTAKADVEKGSLIVDAIGLVEPEVLGTETAYGVLSFHMESYPDQENAPAQPEDMSNPSLQAWQPGDHADKQRPGDPIILNFTEPMAPQSVTPGDSLVLTRDGQQVDFDWYMDGTSLVVQPEPTLQYGSQYQVQFSDGLTDLARNPVQPETVTFTMPAYDSADSQSPVVLTSYPGFPCPTVDENLGNDDAGRCDGGKNSDQHMPLSRLPANRSISVTFSQLMDAATINDDTFVVEEVDADGAPVGDPVAGDIQVSGRKLTFSPQQAWQSDTLYRYTLKSVLENPNCGSNAICSEQATPLPLQTQLLHQGPEGVPGKTQGGPDLAVYFRGAPASNTVFQQLRNLPTSDVNANFLHEVGERVPSGSPAAKKNSARIVRDPEANTKDNDGTAASGAVKDANVGCAVGESCPDAKYSYLSGNLNVEIAGFKTPDEVADYADQESIPEQVKENGGVLVYILPTRIIVSNSTVYADPAIGSAPPSPTGPQLMRIRHTCDAQEGNCDAPDYGRVKGWIVDGQDSPRFLTNLNLYLDAPGLSPQVKILGIPTDLTHNLHSYPLDLQLEGDVTFLEDGRLQIEQISQNAMPLEVVLGNVPLGLPAAIYVGIPAGGAFLNYLSEPIKN